MMHTLPPPAHSLAALRAWMREAGHAAVVVQNHTAKVQPVAPVTLCRHCSLPIAAGGPHGACEQSATEARRG